MRGIEELKYCSWRNSSRSVVGKKCRALRGVGGGKSAAAKNRIAGQTMVYRLKGTVRNKKENLLGRGRGGWVGGSEFLLVHLYARVAAKIFYRTRQINGKRCSKL